MGFPPPLAHWVRLDAGGKTAPHLANETATSDYSRVRMKIMIHSDTIAVTLQTTCKLCSLREGKLSVCPVPTLRERWFAWDGY